MTTDLTSAVRAALDRWTLSATLEQREAEIANVAACGMALGLVVQQTLTAAGASPAVVRQQVLFQPYTHLQGVFDATKLVDTPLATFPVPSTVSTVLARAAALAVHASLGLETVSYGSEFSGHPFVNLVALPGKSVYAEKSKSEMRGHTDGVSFPFNGQDNAENSRIAPSPDLVTLAGLRNPDGVPTRLIPLDSVLAKLTPSQVAELTKPQYSFRSQKSFIEGMQHALKRELVVIDEPILRMEGGYFHVRYSHSNVIPTAADGPAHDAAAAFEAACKEAVIEVAVKPGDLLIIGNRRALHGRGQLADQVGGQSRWLLRCYGLDTSGLPDAKRRSAGSYVLFP